MKRAKIKITVVDRKGPMGCRHGHRKGDTWDWNTQRGSLCPMAQHVMFPYIDILRYGGQLPGKDPDSICVCCPDVDVINVFMIEKIEPEPPASTTQV